MPDRIVGLETEFGCLVRDPSLGSPEEVVRCVKDTAFCSGSESWGLLDRHSRDPYFEPAESGGFLINGGRLYVDSVGDHEEYATPECQVLIDLITYDRAGRRLLGRLLHDLGWSKGVSFHSNSIDHFGGHTFGCHENYSLDPDALATRDSLAPLIPFLVTRQIFAGSGRVGGHRLTRNLGVRKSHELARNPIDHIFIDHLYGVEPDPTVEFQLSQRADHILYIVSERVRFRRALINPKWWDSSNDLDRAPRLHVLFGESNMSEYAAYLKVGTTALVLDLLEANQGPKLRLIDPIQSLRQISRDPTWRWIVRTQKGKTISAVDLQRLYLEAAIRCFSGRDEETDWVLREWGVVLDGLGRDPTSMSDRLDWVAKRNLLETYIDAERIDWGDEVLHSLDLEYHNIDPKNGLYYALESMEQVRRLTNDEAIERALCEPPPDTRAYGRARVIKELLKRGARHYRIEWDSVSAGQRDRRTLILDNPFSPYRRQVERFLRRIW
ncbi:MAG: proteasome accessory factor PafA2 family protein [Candidatus Bipolaricaulia bacterium]